MLEQETQKEKTDANLEAQRLQQVQQQAVLALPSGNILWKGWHMALAE